MTTNPVLHNPFRSPAVTPNPTGASASSTIPSYSSLPPASSPPSYTSVPERPHSDDEESPEALPTLTPRISTPRPALPPRSDPQYPPPATAPPSLPPRQPPSAVNSSRIPPIDDLPPDILPDSAPPAYTLTPNVNGGELVVQQGPRRPFQRAPEPFLQFPAPQSQQQQQFPPRLTPSPSVPSTASERPRSQLSEFAQEFYSAGSATPLPDTQQENQPRYAPPPGAPPPPRRPRAASTSSGAGSTAPPVSDGRPTTTPTPGHPLLRNGMTLVYPDTYSCPKCHNTGYKNYDPSHPCRKCWDRFGKLFTSILASSPWSGQASGSSSQSQRGRSFQRPLPVFKPPQSRPPMPPPPSGMYLPPPGPPGMQRCNSRAVPMPSGSMPPPGATVVMPGDPRIGGRLCWRCGGRGTTPFLIFDESTCETCGGIGRMVN